MSRQITEMLKGVLEGIVLAILATEPAYGYEITARLRRMGFEGIAEGTVYALLVRVEGKGLVDVTKHPSEKGPPRKVYALSAAGSRTLGEFWDNWGFLVGQLETLHATSGADPRGGQHNNGQHHEDNEHEHRQEQEH